MASKKNDELQYGQMPLPKAQKTYTRLKLNWSGLNRRQVIDTGVLSMESNISTAEAPYLTPSQSRTVLRDVYNSDDVTPYKYPISMFGFDGFLIVVYRGGTYDNELLIDYIELADNGKKVERVHTGYITQRDENGNVTKKAVDSSTDSIQRCMVQFNVYENAVDVLDGAYVKKLLLFPDKVSMYMKIVTVTQSPSVLYSRGEITDTDCMYCWDRGTHKSYYTFNGAEGDFVFRSDNYFMTDALDVVVKNYYNDGYVKASGTYNDGYALTSSKYYNDGYKPTQFSKFDDFYVRVTSGSYTSGTYYERIGAYPPYTYTAVYLNEGDSLAGLYKLAITNAAKYTYMTFYERTGSSYPYTYTPVVGLETGDDVSGYYEKVTNSQYPLTQKTFYERIADTYPYKYREVTDLEYGNKVSSYYEKISDTDTEPTTYYKRSGSKPYTYTAVSNLGYGSNLSSYYEKTEDYSPPEGSSTNCYWYNEYDNNSYCYVEDTGDGTGGFLISVPPSFPNLKYAAVHLSRLFGVDDDRVHVSGFNDYSNWNLDTVTESNESNAWSSAAQANTKANGEFTGLAVYDNHVVCFKRDFMHEIYNSKNPFRLVDIYTDGTIDNRSIQEVDGKLIFVSDDEVKVYTGSNPREIGYYLGIDCFKAAVSGTDGRNYYLYCKDEEYNDYLFVYDSLVGQWSQQSIDFSVLNFAHNKNGMYMLADDGIIYKIDTGEYNHEWSFETDMSTALTASSSSSYQTVNIKHISKFQMLAYIEGSMKIYALYDGEEFDADKSHLLYDSGGKTGMIPIRVKPRMTANYGFKLHFEGHGYVRLYEMELRTEAGGEIYV